ncbi:MAG TPA: double-strand break repair protein AddB [Rhizomicrobium sp.]|nr:double-strand break repair protein AddB [Rhizomicrobium sp.]
MSGIFTIAASAPFGETLARGLVERAGTGEFALSDVTVYLPTRRAARNFGEAFARVLGGAALLPQFRALGDSDDDDLFDLVHDGLELPRAIHPIRRQLLLATLIRQWEESRGEEVSFAHAAALAESLAKVMDDVERQRADLNRLDDLAPLTLAAHWENIARFLALIRDEWPALLSAEKTVNPAAQRNRRLEMLAERLAKNPPSGMIIAAGSTGSIPATARLLTLIARLPHGALVLPGLDRGLDEESWRTLDPGHPQYGLKQLLDAAGETRAHVKDWHGAAPNPARESLLSESLRPAPTTDHWRALADTAGGDIAEGLAGIQLVAAADAAEEASVIALALRETLEHEGRTAALVTPDRDLGRRVAAELSRWEIAIDDSAGHPLAHTGAGAFLCLLAEAAETQFAPVPLLALLKHPFASLGDDPASFRAQARALDRLALRGPRPDPGLQGIARRIAQAKKAARNKYDRETCARLASWWERISKVLAPLEHAFANSELPLDQLIATHLMVAEDLSCKDKRDCPLWRDEDGEAAVQFFNNFGDGAQGLPPLDPHAYPALLRALAMKVPVRPRFNRHRAIAILGPLEARLQSFDLVILGGLNEGSWPGAASADPWFSRPMRETLGLEQPERTIGLSAHDFAMLASGREVLLTRATKVEGAPTIASRWLQRMMQLTAGLGLEIAEGRYADAARRLAQVDALTQAQPPMPKPPTEARPRKLSVTEIETWLRDPYAIYARHVLKLEPWDPLDAPIGPLERGLALHKALELYKRSYPTPPEDAVAQLMTIADQVFEELAIPKAMLSVWRPRFECAARWFASFERERAGTIAQSALEIRGERKFASTGGEFTLRGVADRIDILQNDRAAILDYKSGKPPTNAQVKRLLTPQLPLEGAILKTGGFPDLGARDSDELLYLHISGRGEGGNAQPVSDDVPELIEQAWAKLRAWVEHFDSPATPYLSRLQPFSVDSEGDYDHLARVRAWAIIEKEEE